MASGKSVHNNSLVLTSLRSWVARDLAATVMVSGASLASPASAAQLDS